MTVVIVFMNITISKHLTDFLLIENKIVIITMGEYTLLITTDDYFDLPTDVGSNFKHKMNLP